MNSRAKGCRGEREFRDVLRCEGFLKSRRGQQFSGSPDSPDVVCPELPSIHFEVKRTERGNPYDWMAQAQRDAVDKLPVVAHRRNGSEWLAVLRMDDLLKLLKETDRVDGADKPSKAATEPPWALNGHVFTGDDESCDLCGVHLLHAYATKCVPLRISTKPVL